MGTIFTYQRCPKCKGKYPSSKGQTPIQCPTCLTQPTKFFINLWWKGRSHSIYFDREGRGLHHFEHAAALLGEIRVQIRRGTFDPEAYKKNSKSSFKAFYQRFVEGYKDRPGTYDKLKAVGRYLEFFGNYQMRDITPLIIDDWWRELQTKRLSRRYMNDILQWLKSVFKQAHELAVIETPVRRWPAPFTLPGPEIDDWLTSEEQEIVLREIPPWDQAIFKFLFLTGVRVNEATGLQKSDIHWEKGIIVIQHTRKRDGSLGPVKNKKPRIIPLVPDIRETLKVTALGKYQFMNKWGRPYSDDYLRNVFGRACMKALGRKVKLKNATRHSWGMNLIARGENPYKVSKAYGHSDIKMTEHYAQIQAKEFESLYGNPLQNLNKQKSGE